MSSSQRDTREKDDLYKWLASKWKGDGLQILLEILEDYGFVAMALDPHDPYSREDLLDEATKLLQRVRETAALLGVQGAVIGGEDG
ncbi:MAG: hypothetical protein M3198_18155, partial [Actinomycetota bacterium]|nr:hypothetical protein [Actinomycetota bacterium]